MLGWSIASSTSHPDAKQRVTAACRKEGVHAPQHDDSEVPEDDSSNTVPAARELRGSGTCSSDLPNTPLVITLRVLLPPTDRSVRRSSDR